MDGFLVSFQLFGNFKSVKLIYEYLSNKEVDVVDHVNIPTSKKQNAMTKMLKNLN